MVESYGSASFVTLAKAGAATVELHALALDEERAYAATLGARSQRARSRSDSLLPQQEVFRGQESARLGRQEVALAHRYA